VATKAYRAAVEKALDSALGEGRLQEVEHQLKAAEAVLPQKRRQHWQRRLIQERAKTAQSTPESEAKKGVGGAPFRWLIGLALIGLAAFLGYSWWEAQPRTPGVSSQSSGTPTGQSTAKPVTGSSPSRQEPATGTDSSPTPHSEPALIPFTVRTVPADARVRILNLETAVDRFEWLASDCIAEGY